MNDETLTDIVRGLIRKQPEMIEWLVVEQIKTAIRGSLNSDGKRLNITSISEVLGLEIIDIDVCLQTGIKLRK